MTNPTLVTDAELAALRAAVARAEPAFLADPSAVSIDCGGLEGRVTRSGPDGGRRALGERLSNQRRGPGRQSPPSRRHRPGGAGPLCIGHMDTVFDPGTAAARPFTIEQGIATGRVYRREGRPF
jgi:hypothetical protein